MTMKYLLTAFALVAFSASAHAKPDDWTGLVCNTSQGVTDYWAILESNPKMTEAEFNAEMLKNNIPCITATIRYDYVIVVNKFKIGGEDSVVWSIKVEQLCLTKDVCAEGNIPLLYVARWPNKGGEL